MEFHQKMFVMISVTGEAVGADHTHTLSNGSFDFVR